MIKRLKDVLYDTNDIIVVLIIIILALFVISSRIEVIMEYPAGGDLGIIGSGEEEGTVIGSEEAGTGADGENYTDPALIEPDAGAAAGGAETNTAEGTEPGQSAAGSSDSSGEVTQYSIYIEYGETASQIAQKLLDVGLIKDKDDFYDALLVADAATRLQAGNFIIPSNAKLDEIVKILTGR
ncbi:MAG: endolytic transglycosylase MltG [Clostridiales Family XIII bacterium]|jgi:hypothetical protein|nr:endolytic transglycosylase MltG [Clostridiales Family XIII bacterium]